MLKGRQKNLLKISSPECRMAIRETMHPVYQTFLIRSEYFPKVSYLVHSLEFSEDDKDTPHHPMLFFQYDTFCPDYLLMD